MAHDNNLAEEAMRAEIAALRQRLVKAEEAEETLRAIHSGEVDALVVESSAGPRVFTLQGLDAEVNRLRGEILAQVSDAVIATDDNHRVTYFNTAAENLYGVTASAALGCRVFDIYQNVWSSAQGEAAAAAVLRQTGRWQGETMHIKRDGGEIHVESSVSLLHLADGACPGQLCVIRDITERKRSEELLRESERLYRAIGESINYGIWVCDAQGRNTYASESFLRLLGITQEQCSNLGWGDHLHPDDLAATIAAWKQCVQTGGPWYREHRYRGADGRWHPILACGVAVRAEQGQITHWAGINLDISQLKQTEESLRDSEIQLRTVTQNAGVGLCLLDSRGHVVQTNPEWLRVSGFTEASVLGRHIWELFPESPPELRRWHDQVRAGTAIAVPAYRQLTGDRETWHEGRLSPVAMAGGTGILITTVDITERKQAGQALQKAHDELERRVLERTADLKRSNQQLEHFAYVASHDLQEPLRTVGSFSQLLARQYQGKLDAEADEFINFIVAGAKRMQTLINDLLAFSRVGAKGQMFARVAAEAILQTAQDNLEVAIAESGAVITHDPLPTLWCDQGQLTQVFQNLLSNAIKFRQPDTTPRVHLSASLQGDHWQLSVRDNGVGIDPQYFARIFVIFQRLHDRDTYPGTGIGLAICKKIIERHGGRLWVESTPGVGSCFHFTLLAGKATP